MQNLKILMVHNFAFSSVRVLSIKISYKYPVVIEKKVHTPKYFQLAGPIVSSTARPTKFHKNSRM